MGNLMVNNKKEINEEILSLERDGCAYIVRGVLPNDIELRVWLVSNNEASLKQLIANNSLYLTKGAKKKLEEGTLQLDSKCNSFLYLYSKLPESTLEQISGLESVAKQSHRELMKEYEGRLDDPDTFQKEFSSLMNKFNRKIAPTVAEKMKLLPELPDGYFIDRKRIHLIGSVLRASDLNQNSMAISRFERDDKGMLNDRVVKLLEIPSTERPTAKVN